MADLSRAIEISPAMAAAYLERGLLVLRSGGDRDQARADILEALERAEDPRSPIVYQEARKLLEELDAAEASGGGNSFGG